jgi:hypothetical protein
VMVKMTRVFTRTARTPSLRERAQNRTCGNRVQG